MNQLLLELYRKVYYLDLVKNINQSIYLASEENNSD